MTTRFLVHAQAEPGSLVRLLDPFAQRGLVPSMMNAQIHGDELEVVIEQSMLDEATATNICARMNNMVAVRLAIATPVPAPLSPS